jgi:hypothetical protein
MGELSKLIEDAELPVYAGDSTQAVRGWWQSVVHQKLDPYEMATLWFGATPEQLDAMVAAGEPLGLALQRVMIARELTHKERIAQVEDRLYLAALSDNGATDRKLFLQANKPQVYDRPKEAKITIEAVKQVLAEETTDELKRIAGIGDTETS